MYNIKIHITQYITKYITQYINNIYLRKDCYF